jgi:hypothetical protein
MVVNQHLTDNNSVTYNSTPTYNNAPSYSQVPNNSPSRDREIQPEDKDMDGLTTHLEENVTYNFSSLEDTDSEPLFVKPTKTRKTKPKVTKAQSRVRKYKPKGPTGAADYTFSDLQDEADEPVLIRPRKDPTKKGKS